MTFQQTDMFVMFLWRGKVHCNHKAEQISREQRCTRIISDRTDGDMDRIHLHFTVRTSLSFLLLILLQTSTEAQDICSVPGPVQFAENNAVGDVVVTITVQPDVTLAFRPPPANPNNPFILERNQLVAARVLDYETETTHVVSIACNASTGLQLALTIIIIVTNVNDNPPVFEQDVYHVNVDEMSSVDTSVGTYPATDLDGQPLYYTLTSDKPDAFKLSSPTTPTILVQTPLEYDKVKNVKLVLYAQDTPLAPPNTEPSFTASTTIMVTIADVDNRPPWFQPCTQYEIGGVLICQSSGYTGRVNLNEQETGPLTLKPGPIHAIDGDSGINEEMTYSFLSGVTSGLFEINPNTGTISMLRPADMLETISLTVLARQKINSYQVASTTVTVSVQVKSLHPPKFQRPQYEGIVTAVGTMVMDQTNKDKPLLIFATDDDYAATGGVNPHITYSIKDSSDFTIIGGYLFMTKDLPEGALHLQVVATDMTNDDSATADLFVEVTSGLTSTSMPPSTTDRTTLTPTEASTTNSKTTPQFSLATDGGVSTTHPSQTSEGSVDTAGTAHPHTAIIPSGGYGPGDMAAVGATLGVLLFICLVVIVVLIFNIQRGKADWKKIYETSMFRSSLGQASGGLKEGIQYTNDAFQNDDDSDSTGSGSFRAGEPRKTAENFRRYEEIVKSSALPHDDNASQASSDKDSEKEVKPILTKERRMDEGYKSVWFKEDIDPNAKEEVVIIPDSRESDSDEEDDEQPSSSRDEDDPRAKTPKVVFNDADLDSGLGVKIEDPAEDSEDDQSLTADL